MLSFVYELLMPQLSKLVPKRHNCEKKLVKKPLKNMQYWEVFARIDFSSVTVTMLWTNFTVGYINSIHSPVYCRVTIFSIAAINSMRNVSFNFELKYSGGNVENTTTNTRISMYKPLERANGSYAVVVCINYIFKDLFIYITRIKFMSFCFLVWENSDGLDQGLCATR